MDSTAPIWGLIFKWSRRYMVEALRLMPPIQRWWTGRGRAAARRQGGGEEAGGRSTRSREQEPRGREQEVSLPGVGSKSPLSLPGVGSKSPPYQGTRGREQEPSLPGGVLPSYRF